MRLRYRPDIDGLRALAVLAIILFHAKYNFFNGGFVGVDIFFVISGYLITSILFGELDQNGRIDFINFWARRTRRLAPSALLVIVVTLAASTLVVSKLEFYFSLVEGVYAAIYVVNWYELIRAVHYFDDSGTMKPFLHYWSLAVEEQFYLYITIVFLVGMISRKLFQEQFSWTTGRIVVVLILLSAICSFATNLYLIEQAQPAAFFATPARIWQLALGAGIGILERRGCAPSPLTRASAAWLGLSTMLFAILYYSPEMSYPGINAVLPSLGAGLFILAGINRAEGPLALPLKLAARPIPVTIGKLSYSLYLWHWPVFVLYRAYAQAWTERDQIIAITATVVLAAISYFTVENPIRYSRTLSRYPLASLSAAAALSLSIFAGGYFVQQIIAGNNVIELSGGGRISTEAVLQDLPLTYNTFPRCHLYQHSEDYPSCVFGARDSERHMFLFGDSHAAQWFPTYEKLALKYGFALYSRTKAACASLDTPVWNDRLKRTYTECAKWREKVLAEIEQVKPQIVVLAHSAGHKPLDSNGHRYKTEVVRLKVLRDAERRTVERIRATGALIVFMFETPRYKGSPLDCLVSNPKNEQTCRVRLSKAFSAPSPWSFDRSAPLPGTSLVDLTDRLCQGGFCYVADQTMIRMRDPHHITAQFAASLLEQLEVRFPYITQDRMTKAGQALHRK